MKHVIERDLLTHARKCLYRYGAYTNEDRAIPDYRDGLKPVHRRILWAMHTYQNGSWIKTARVSGDCFAAGTLVTLANGVRVPIEQIVVGDVVLTDAGTFDVVNTFVRAESDLYEVATSEGVVQATPDQIFYCLDSKGNEVAKTTLQLQPGDTIIRQISPPVATVVSVTKIPGKHLTFDFEVDSRHRFYANGFLVHNCSGKYHPHGTAGIEGGVATLVNSPEPVLEGMGNWGTVMDPPAAARYTNVRLSAYGKQLLDKDYLAVSDVVPNYDENDTDPVVLPALLPNLILNGTEGIGVGIRNSIPSYRLKSVLEVLLLRMSQREPLSPQQLAKTLVFKFAYGGEFLNTKDNRIALREFYKNGRGTVAFKSRLVEQLGKFVWNDFAPNVSVENGVNKLKALPQVARVENTTDTKGVSFEITLKPRLSEQELAKVRASIVKITTGNKSFQISLTERTKTGNKVDVKLFPSTISEFIERWLKYRVDLETRCLDYKIAREKRDIAYSKLLIHAADNLATIMAALSKEDPAAHIAKGLKITVEQANQILDLKVRQLSKLDKTRIETRLKAQQATLSQLETWRTRPTAKVKTDVQKVLDGLKDR